MEVISKIRKEYKAFGKVELMIDVYSDRVNFLGYNDFMVNFFQRRGVVAHYDRGGISIDSTDATKLGIELKIGSYLASCKDLRKKLVAC
jgi:hypothetical protein